MALREVCLDLTLQLARDGEGATKLLTVTVRSAADAGPGPRVAKAVVNSPLVKTAVHGADPNWGRVAMAIGKCQDDEDIDPERVVIRFGDLETYPNRPDEKGLGRLADLMAADHVEIEVELRHRRGGGHRVRVRPVRRLRPHQRRLHHLAGQLAGLGGHGRLATPSRWRRPGSPRPPRMPAMPRDLQRRRPGSGDRRPGGDHDPEREGEADTCG